MESPEVRFVPLFKTLLNQAARTKRIGHVFGRTVTGKRDLTVTAWNQQAPLCEHGALGN